MSRITCLLMALLLFFAKFAVALKPIATPYQTPIIERGMAIKSGDKAFDIFAKKVDVFGVSIYATQYVSDTVLTHVAGVLAQYLDNNEDGLADEPQVVARLKKDRAAMVLFKKPDSALFKKFDRLFDPDKDKRPVQDLYASEVVLVNGDKGRFDETLEEVLHLITHAGWGKAYPHVFAEKHHSAIADAMDKARGGYFKKSPKHYPANAWYTYDDKTCDYGCQITEYTYWLLTSFLSKPGRGQDFKGRYAEIKREWRPNNHIKVVKMDRLGAKILKSKRYHLPKRLPNGLYPFHRFQ